MPVRTFVWEATDSSDGAGSTNLCDGSAGIVSITGDLSTEMPGQPSQCVHLQDQYARSLSGVIPKARAAAVATWPRRAEMLGPRADGWRWRAG